MTVHLLKAVFSRGEFSPKAYSRVDLEAYGGGAETLVNWISHPVGGIRRRSGTRFGGKAKFPDKLAAFVPFVFSSGDSCILEFGDFYIRFWVPGPAQVLDPMTFQPLEVATPYSHLDVFSLQYVQVGDTIYIACKGQKPRRLQRASLTSWSLNLATFVDGPYLGINDTDTTFHVDEADTNVKVGTTKTLLFSSVTGINGGLGFVSTDVGRHLRIRPAKGINQDLDIPANGVASEYGPRWVYGLITAVNSTTSIEFQAVRIGDGTTEDDRKITDRTIAGDCPATGNQSGSWRLGAFSDTTGWPACVEVFESRLVWANTPVQQRTVHFSRTGLPTDYAPSAGDSTVVASHGMSLSVLAGQADEILWLKEAPRLQVGTASGVRTIGGTDTSRALTPLEVSQRLEINYGVASCLPGSAGTANIAAGRFGTELRNIFFSYEVNQIVAPDISRLHQHLLAGRVAKIVYQQAPESVLWVLTDEGTVFGITYDQQEKLTSFHRHDFGAGSVVVNIEVIPGPDRDQLWLLVNRKINGQEQMYVETMEPDFNTDLDDLEAAFFVDCGATYFGGPTNTISGLDHLAGESVVALVDGAVIRDLTVDLNGVLTLPDNRTGTFVHIGYSIVSEFKTLRPPHQQQDGWTLGRNQRVANVLVEVIKTGGLKIGTNPDNAATVEDRLTDTPFGVPTELKHGVYKTKVEDEWRQGGQVYGVVTDPLPAYVRSLLITLDIENAR